MKRILSIDGGGIKGLVPALWLEHIEKEVGPLHEIFDLVAGTSVGSIIACSVSAGKSATEMVDNFTNNAHQIFPSFISRVFSRICRSITDGISAPKYDGHGLNKFLQDEFCFAPYSGLKCHTLIPAFDVDLFQPTVFKSWRTEWNYLPIWEVCRASSSAPIFFPAHIIKERPFVDGAIVANNPTACAVAEARRLWGDEELTVVSLGTGKPRDGIEAEDALTWGATQWALSLPSLFFEGSDASMNYIAQQMNPKHFFRLEPSLSDHVAIDDTSCRAMALLKAAAQRQMPELEPITRLLVDNKASKSP